MANLLPAPGDTFDIYTSSTQISILSGLVIVGGMIILKDLIINLPAATPFLPSLLLSDTQVMLSGVQFLTSSTNPTNIVLDRSVMTTGSANLGLPNTAQTLGTVPIGMSAIGRNTSNLSITCQNGSELTLPNTYLEHVQLSTGIGGSVVSLSFVVSLVCLFIANGGEWTSSTCRQINHTQNGLQASNGAVANLSDVFITGAASNGVLVDTGATATLTNMTITGSAVNGVFVDNGGLAIITNADISSSTASGVFIDNGGTVRVNTIVSTTPNGTFGIFINYQSRLMISFSTTITITGSTADALVGTNAPTTWANLISGASPRSDYASAISHFASVSY